MHDIFSQFILVAFFSEYFDIQKMLKTPSDLEFFQLFSFYFDPKKLQNIDAGSKAQLFLQICRL